MSPRVLAWALLLAASRAAGAQSTSETELNAGVARVQQRARNERRAAVVSALWRTADPRSATIVQASLTNTGDSAAAAQLVGAGAWRRTPDSWLVLEGSAGLNFFGVSNLARGGNWHGVLRSRVNVGPGGAWVSAGAGHSIRDSDPSHATALEAGAWISGAGFTASAAATRQRTDDWPLMEAAGIFLNRNSLMADVDDVLAGLRWESGRFTADVQKSWRIGRRSTLASQQALAWSANWELTDRVALAVGGGRLLADPVRGTPDATVASVSVKVRWRPSRSEADAPGVVSSARLVPQEGGGALLVLAVTAPDGVSVDVAGDFSGWEPAPLHRTSSGWELQVLLTRGRHRVAIRYDGGPWRAPGNLGKMKDEFGGAYGVIIVP